MNVLNAKEMGGAVNGWTIEPTSRPFFFPLLKRFFFLLKSSFEIFFWGNLCGFCGSPVVSAGLHLARVITVLTTNTGKELRTQSKVGFPFERREEGKLTS